MVRIIASELILATDNEDDKLEDLYEGALGGGYSQYVLRIAIGVAHRIILNNIVVKDHDIVNLGNYIDFTGIKVIKKNG